MMEAKRPFPSPDTHGDAIVRDQVQRAAIVGLGDSIRPPAIPRLIASVVINAIHGEARRARAHVPEKGRETLGPLLTHVDPAGTVVFPMLRGGAPFLSVRPGAIFTSASKPVAEISARRSFAAQAATTTAGAIEQRAEVNLTLSSAITTTQPPPGRLGRTDHYPAIESSSNGDQHVTRFYQPSLRRREEI